MIAQNEIDVSRDIAIYHFIVGCRIEGLCSRIEIMTILIMFHFGTFDNFKHYYLHFIRIYLKRDFPDAVSYNRFVELESRVFFKMMFFLNLHSFGRCTGITFPELAQ